MGGLRAAAALACLIAAVLASGPVRAQLVIRGGAGTIRNCAGGDAQVIANRGSFAVTGACSALRLFGSGNTVVVDLAPGASVQVTGDRNRVAYRTASGTPATAIGGRDDLVQPATAAELAALPGPLVIPAGGLAGHFDCGGRDVLIHASYGHYALYGGCRSVTVDGTSTTILAELLPGAALAVGAAGVAINYVLTADGAPPVVQVTAPGERAPHIQRNNGSLLQLPTGLALQ